MAEYRLEHLGTVRVATTERKRDWLLGKGYTLMEELEAEAVEDTKPEPEAKVEKPKGSKGKAAQKETATEETVEETTTQESEAAASESDPEQPPQS